VSELQYSKQIGDFLKSRAPEPRRKLRDALHDLEIGKGDIRSLHDELSGYCRLRVGEYRIIFHYVPGEDGPVCYCDFVESRAVVYEAFAAVLSEEGRI
jgi:mRNA-degrading endonuclease RelE of RelBE toxin-antitoxin system